MLSLQNEKPASVWNLKVAFFKSVAATTYFGYGKG
jgi:hypothetical protein